MADIDHVIEMRIDRIARQIKGRARASTLTGDEFTRLLQVETELSLRASSPDWCPTRCLGSDGLPVLCDHGKPLSSDQRERWIKSYRKRPGEDE